MVFIVDGRICLVEIFGPHWSRWIPVTSSTTKTRITTLTVVGLLQLRSVHTRHMKACRTLDIWLLHLQHLTLIIFCHAIGLCELFTSEMFLTRFAEIGLFSQCYMRMRSKYFRYYWSTWTSTWHATRLQKGVLGERNVLLPVSCSVYSTKVDVCHCTGD